MALIAKDYWDRRYEQGKWNSGYGSYGEQLEKKLGWLKGLNIESISEIGCGDFNFGKNLLTLYPHATYSGYDISEIIIEKNKKEFPQYLFTTNFRELPDGDLLLCVDVLFHVLDKTEYTILMINLKQMFLKGKTKYLAITAYENEQETSPHLKIRKFDPSYFGEPIIREIVEEQGQLYFYLYKKESGVDLSKVSLCLLTKEFEYPQEILAEVGRFKFGEVIVGTNSSTPYLKHELFKKAKFDLIAYQDDDCIVSWEELAKQSKPDIINVAMKQGHIESHKDTRMTMGLGWGSIFPKKLLEILHKYTDKYGFDEVYQRETERIFTYLNYPQNRLDLPITDLPSAWNEDRLWRQPNHEEFKRLAEERCKELI